MHMPDPKILACSDEGEARSERRVVSARVLLRGVDTMLSGTVAAFISGRSNSMTRSANGVSVSEPRTPFCGKSRPPIPCV